MSRWLTEEAAAVHQARMRGLTERVPAIVKDDAREIDTEAGQGRKVTLVLPLPPSLNHATRHANGAHYLTAEHRNYRVIVANALLALKAPKLIGRLGLAIVVYPADKRRWDLANREKCLTDALEHGGLFDDDEQIDHLEMTRVHGTKRGECTVIVRELG
jgi:crossover junction endodeoxyribonuclease RusA